MRYLYDITVSLDEPLRFAMHLDMNDAGHLAGLTNKRDSRLRDDPARQSV